MVSTSRKPDKNLRWRAWRNMLVAAVNEGLRRELFSIHPGNNRWPGHNNCKSSSRGEPYIYDFTFPGSIQALACVGDAGFDELSIHVALWPTGDFIECANAYFLAGDAFACGWLERRDGAWLQNITDSFSCRRHLLQNIANVDIKPDGYGESRVEYEALYGRHAKVSIVHENHNL